MGILWQEGGPAFLRHSRPRFRGYRKTLSLLFKWVRKTISAPSQFQAQGAEKI
jgi:hypothetical protein